MDEYAASHIKQNNNKIELTYHNKSFGCVVFAGILFIVMCLSIFFFLPNRFAIRGIFVGFIGLVFASIVMKRMISIRKKGSTLITIENNRIRNEKHDIALADITKISYGWQLGTYKSIFFTTIDNKTYTYSLYNLVDDEVIEQFVDTFVIPHVPPNVIHDKEKLDHYLSEKLLKKKS